MRGKIDQKVVKNRGRTAFRLQEALEGLLGASRRPLGFLPGPPGASGGPLGGVQEAPKRVFKGIIFPTLNKVAKRVGWRIGVDTTGAVLGGSLEVSNRHPGS